LTIIYFLDYQSLFLRMVILLIAVFFGIIKLYLLNFFIINTIVYILV